MSSSKAMAQGADGEIAPRHVEIKIVAANDADQGIEIALRELLDRLQVSVHFSNIGSVDEHQILAEHPDEPPAVARVWIDLRSMSRVTLYLTGMREDRVLVRHVPLVNRVDEVAKEEIAHIVEATVDALLVGGRIGVATDETPSKAPRATPASPQQPTGMHLDIGLGYEAMAWSSTHPILQGPGVFVGLGPRAGTVRPSVWVSGELRFPTEVQGDPISTRLDQGSVRVVGVLDWAISRRWSLLAGLGGGVDWVRITPEAKLGANVELEPARFATLPMLRGMATVRYGLSARVGIFAGFATDFDWLDTRYLVQRGAGEDAIFHPWRFRPLALLGVSSDVLAY